MTDRAFAQQCQEAFELRYAMETTAQAMREFVDAWAASILAAYQRQVAEHDRREAEYAAWKADRCDRP